MCAENGASFCVETLIFARRYSYADPMSYLLSSRHVFVRSGSSQVFVRLPGDWSDDARYLSDAQHAAEGWVHVRPLSVAAPETPDT